MVTLPKKKKNPNVPYPLPHPNFVFSPILGIQGIVLACTATAVYNGRSDKISVTILLRPGKGPTPFPPPVGKFHVFFFFSFAPPLLANFKFFFSRPNEANPTLTQPFFFGLVRMRNFAQMRKQKGTLEPPNLDKSSFLKKIKNSYQNRQISLVGSIAF